MKVFLLSMTFSLIAFFLVMNNEEKKAILLIIFVIPFFYYPLENSKIHIGININMSGLIIFFVWFAMLIKNKKMNWNKLSPKLVYLYYFLFAGIILGLVYSEHGVEYLGGRYINVLSPQKQILNNSVFVILVILFFKILSRFQYDISFLEKAAKIFTFTIFIQVFSQSLKIFGFDNILWSLLSPIGVFNIKDIRNTGLWGGFGFGVYVVLIIAFSLIYYHKHKNLSKICIFFVFIYSILSGQRQSVAFIGLFIVMLILVYTIKRKLSVVHSFLVLTLIVSVIILWEPFLSKTVVFRRFTPAIANINSGLMLEASGRNVAGIPFVIADLENYPITGRGLLDLGLTKYSSTNIAGHVVWFNIYQKFGIAGVLYLLIIIIIPITKLLIISIKTTNSNVYRESSILFSLMVIVFAQQFWDNFFSFSNTMLLYGFIYFWVFSFINRQKIKN
jgi:hypothetical protein